MEWKWKCILRPATVAVVLMAAAAHADTETPSVRQLEEMVVTEQAGAPGIVQQPEKTVIGVQALPTVGVPGSIVDVLKGYAIIDFRGESDIDAGVDSVYLRGFDAKRFVTAIDGVTLQKTGGRKSSNIVDYATLPAFLIDTVEILPGPHSALFDSKAIGGVLNLKTAAPKRRDGILPDGKLTVGFSSYDTWTQEMTVQGAARAVTYDVAYKHSSSDGFLRNNATDMDTVYGRLGFVLPSDGFVALSMSYSDVDREAPVTNAGADYDSDYPKVESATFDPWQQPTWDGLSYAYRLNAEQSSPIGRLRLGAYYGKDNRKRAYYAAPDDATPSVMDTDWWQQGGKLEDEIRWSDAHTTTVGFDMAQLSDDGVDNDRTERINKKGGYVQHRWLLTPSLDLRVGLRYEDVEITVTNNGVIPDRPDLIERDWGEFVPKSFLTWKLEHMAPWLRDTSLSFGASKIWRAPDYHGDYNPQGRPAGAWLDPEHGMGYDLVLSRRLWRDVGLKVNYAFYRIEDYIATNSSYAKYSGKDAGNLRYSDYKINLDEVYRHGVDVELGGHLTDLLSFYLTYSWQQFDNQGDEPAGETELDQRAANRVTAGLSYKLFATTDLTLDYYYQSKETTEISEEIAEDVWYFTQVDNDAYQVVDFGVCQQLFKGGAFPKTTLRVYVKNLFDERYKNASGYPATDRTFGAAVTLSI